MSPAVDSPLRVVVLDDYQDVARSSADWSALGGDVEVRAMTEHVSEERELLAALEGADVVVAMRERTPLGTQLLRQLPHLKLVITTGMRNASIEAPPGLLFCGTRALTSPTVELTWALIHAARRQLGVELPAMRAGGWQSTVGEGLEGATLGIIGLGNIGTRVAAVANAFGMRVLAWSANLTDDDARERGASRVGLDELLAASDVVTIHTRLSERTRGLLGRRELALLGSHALLVNTSRAPIVDQDALLEALHEGTLGGVALDVFDEEPLPAQHAWRTAPRATLTPHLGYVTRQNYELFYRDAVDDIAAFRAGAPIRVISS